MDLNDIIMKRKPKSAYGKISKAIEDGKVDLNKYLKPKERPILFSTPMVKAILEGRKTQTRRTRNLERVNVNPDSWFPREYCSDGVWFKNKKYKCPFIKYPYGSKGDLLWVREAWCPQINGFGQDTDREPFYKADKIELPVAHKWRSSLFMPRWACRIILKITSVRVQRLHDITVDDIHDEGIPYSDKVYLMTTIIRDQNMCPTMGKEFMLLWESIHGKGSWKLNPWLWVIGFERIKP